MMPTTALIPQKVGYIEPVVEFVSLVAHAANREPFLILKSDEGENMKKAIISVLVPKTLTDSERVEALKDYNNADQTEYDTYTKYTQITDDCYDADSIELITLNKEKGVMGAIAAVTTKGSSDVNTATETDNTTIEKESVEYQTMDSVYTEMWALQDIVYGVMNQAHSDAAFKANVILTAIENTRTLFKQMFDTLPPDVQKKAYVMPDNAKTQNTKKEDSEAIISEEPKVSEDVKTMMEGLSAKLMESLMSMKSELTNKLESVSVEVDKLKNTATEVTTKSSELECIIKKQEEVIENLSSQPKTKSDHRYFDDLLYVDKSSDVKNEKELFKGVLFG